jgi:peroxisomal 3,2-trans-enoyl-CoA isomerase
MYVEVRDSLLKLSKDQNVKVGLITASGDFFSSGNDLSNFSQLMHPLKMAAEAKVLCETFVNAFILFEKPLIAAVNGPAIGIAATTLGLVDYVFVTKNAYFRTPFAELGQAPEGCSTLMFPRLMGEEISKKVLDNGMTLTADEALNCGFVHSILPEDALQPAAMAFCHALAKLPADSVSLVRPIIREQLVQTLVEVNRTECELCEKKWISRECFIALSAYLDSRNMKFAALVLRFANLTGSLWGQPRWQVMVMMVMRVMMVVIAQTLFLYMRGTILVPKFYRNRDD